MKKSIFKVVFLTTLILILTVSCTSPTEETSAKLPVLTDKQKVANSSALPNVYDVYDIPAYIGALHNAGIYAFVDYVQENNLSPYEVGGLTEAMIDTFAMNYVDSLLLPILDQFEPNISVSTIVLDVLSLEYSTIIDSISDIEEINNVIQERTEYVYGCFGVQDEDMVIYDVIKEIAIATNVLWGRDWDFTTPIFENPDPDYASVADDNGENSEVKSKEDKDKLKKADVNGAIEGAIKGAITLAGVGGVTGAGMIVTAVWGAVLGAASGAVAGSVMEYVRQEVTTNAQIMNVEYVIPDTYLYNYVYMLRMTNFEEYERLFGDKFEPLF